MAVAAHRGLYDPARPEPLLAATRCAACGRLFVPPVGLGCPSCGATEDQLLAVEVPARGRLHSVATVHRHRARGLDGPYAIGEIQLDDGPLVRCLLDVPESEVRIGDRVAARWVVVGTVEEGDRAGEEIVEPRFAPVTTSAEAAR
jgi:uncharacterized OB-fold protein